MEFGQPVLINKDIKVDSYDGLWILPQMLKFAGKPAKVIGKKHVMGNDRFVLDVDDKKHFWPEVVLEKLQVDPKVLRHEKLRKFTVKELTEELVYRNRDEGVQPFKVKPFEEVKLLVNLDEKHLDIGPTGPATILVVYD